MINQALVIPPGYGNITLNYLSIFTTPFLLIANVSVGGENATVPFAMISTNPDILLSTNNSDYDPLVSDSYVSNPFSLRPVQVYDPGFGKTTVFAQTGYEFFNFSNLTIHGQGFSLTSGNINVSRMGFSFNKTQSLGFPMFLDKLYQEAQIGSRILAFLGRFSVDQPYNSGAMYLGSIDESLYQGPLTNYSVTIENGNWAFGLSDIAFGDVGLGYNGFVTIDTTSPFNVVPMPVFAAIVNLINIPHIILPYGELVEAVFQCSALDFNTLPNITYYLDHQPLVMTPYQYIGVGPYGFCGLAFAGTDVVSPVQAAFTLGTLLMNSTFTVFDFDQKTFGFAYAATIN